ncbi:MAG: hypothetical protein NC120_06180 [Ruminococcus sp.]|nr:hypothetical protein [Ruminococcus sp.]
MKKFVMSVWDFLSVNGWFIAIIIIVINAFMDGIAIYDIKGKLNDMKYDIIRILSYEEFGHDKVR